MYSKVLLLMLTPALEDLAIERRWLVLYLMHLWIDLWTLLFGSAFSNVDLLLVYWHFAINKAYDTTE